MTDVALLGEGSTLGLAAAVIGVLVVSRAAAMFAASALAGRRARLTGSALPYGRRESAVAAWAGMRGVVTVATALALPVAMDDGAPFPFRDEVVLVALLVVVVTLVLQGLTLAPLIRRLGVADEADPAADARDLQRTIALAALEVVRRCDDVPEPIRAAVARQYEDRLDQRGQVHELIEGDVGGAQTGGRLRALMARAAEAEREAVLDARRSGRVSPGVADDVLSDIETRALRYGS